MNPIKMKIWIIINRSSLRLNYRRIWFNWLKTRCFFLIIYNAEQFLKPKQLLSWKELLPWLKKCFLWFSCQFSFVFRAMMFMPSPQEHALLYSNPAITTGYSPSASAPEWHRHWHSLIIRTILPLRTAILTQWRIRLTI